MSRPGFGLSLCLEDNLMLAKKTSSQTGRWEEEEMIQQHKINFYLHFPCLDGPEAGQEAAPPLLLRTTCMQRSSQELAHSLGVTLSIIPF